MSETKPTPAEEAWERAGYLHAAFTAIESAADVAADSVDPSFISPAARAAWERGRARWKAEHPEVRE
jgi:hypothetical protein